MHPFTKGGFSRGVFATCFLACISSIVAHANVPSLSWAKGVITDGYQTLVRNPLFQLYIHGPRMAHLGGWQGMQDAQICAHITGQSETFWIQHEDDCTLLVAKRFDSAVTSLEVLLYFICAIRMVLGFNALLWNICTTRIIPRPSLTARKDYDTRRIQYQYVDKGIPP